MNFTIITIVTIATIFSASSVLAGENVKQQSEILVADVSATPSQQKAEKRFSIGPAIEFGGGGTSFGITGKVGISEQFSLRPLVLFGYKPTVSRSNVNQIYLDGGDTQAAINGSPGIQAGIDAVLNSRGTGIGYGLAVTYDFKSPDSKILGYIGPRILFGSASGRGIFTADNTPFTTNTSETSIGLTAGADYAISPDVTAGLTATYNISRTGTFSEDSGGIKGTVPLSGSTFNVGINVGYNF